MPERLAFVVMFTVMATFVVGLSVLAAKTEASTGANRSVADGLHTTAAQQGEKHTGGSVHRAPLTVSARSSPALDARLTAALRAALGARAGRLSVGVIDTRTGAEALYGAAKRYHAGGIAGVDILAALLHEQQRAGTQISNKDAGLAAKVMKNGGGAGGTRLWRAIGRGEGLAAANRTLGLRHTVPGVADEWSLTRTTVTDQLRLLTDLATARSPLHSAGRNYELDLMSSVAPTWRWGVPAAASPGTSYALKNGWLANPRRFVVNSIGVIHRDGHELLVVVLSRNWPTELAGISEVQAAADAAVGAMLTSA